MDIRFGTSGWRAIIADEFTFEKVKLVTNAVCSYLKTISGDSEQKLIIAHDSRFMGEQFSQVAADIAASKGFTVLLCNGPTPTPTVSHAIRDNGALGALNFTASHNPPEYQGIKFSTSDGAPALPEITKEIERLIKESAEAANQAGGTIKDFDPRPAYLDDLKTKVRFDAIAENGGSYAYDALWGTGRGYLDDLLRENGHEVETLHDWRDVTFEGMSPEPGPKQLEGLCKSVVENGHNLGLATDGDGDRFGVVDADGSIIEPNKLIAILCDYLYESRGWKEGLARSVATTHLIDRVAKDRGIEIFETPVGFKFIGDLINKDKIILGGEESAGLSIKGHYPEKDGIIACLLAVEAVAVRGKSLKEQYQELVERVGDLKSGRIGVALNEEVAAKLKEKLSREPEKIGDRTVENINRMDGVKFLFADAAWMLMRPSGTEPLVRIYAEAENQTELEELLEEGRSYLLE